MCVIALVWGSCITHVLYAHHQLCIIMLISLFSLGFILRLASWSRRGMHAYLLHTVNPCHHDTHFIISQSGLSRAKTSKKERYWSYYCSYCVGLQFLLFTLIFLGRLASCCTRLVGILLWGGERWGKNIFALSCLHLTLPHWPSTIGRGKK